MLKAQLAKTFQRLDYAICVFFLANEIKNKKSLVVDSISPQK